MMEFTNLTMQLQSANWGWSIAFFLWFIGLSGMGMFLNGWVREKALVYLCAIASILGTLLVVSHLARLTNLPAAAFYALTSGSFNFGSWMMIGMVLLTLQCCATVFYALSLAGVFKSCEDFVLSNFFNHITMALGVIVTIYSGFLLTQAVGVTLWNTALIPLLWIMSGMGLGHQFHRTDDGLGKDSGTQSALESPYGSVDRSGGTFHDLCLCARGFEFVVGSRPRRCRVSDRWPVFDDVLVGRHSLRFDRAVVD